MLLGDGNHSCVKVAVVLLDQVEASQRLVDPLIQVLLAVALLDCNDSSREVALKHAVLVIELVASGAKVAVHAIVIVLEVDLRPEADEVRGAQRGDPCGRERQGGTVVPCGSHRASRDGGGTGKPP